MDHQFEIEMFDTISNGTKSAAILMNAKGVTQSEIASILGISESTIKRAKARDLKYGDINAGYKICGRKPVIGPCMRDVLSLLLEVTTNLGLGDSGHGLQGA